VRSAEIHFTHRVGWLRAAVLGANDGIVSTAVSTPHSPIKSRRN
jgi:VIT1/CCC1 family predicted Fe2+/Mn2+ transporter